MRKAKKILSIIILTALCSCSDDMINKSSFGESQLIKGSARLNDKMKKKINGIYKVIDGKNKFGEKVVAKWVGDTLSLFTGKDYANFILRGGILDTMLIFKGEWKFSFSQDIYLSRLYVNYSEGAKELLNGSDSISKIIFRGKTGNSADKLADDFSFELERNVDYSNQQFQILAHRGGSSSYKGIATAENSLAMIRLGEKYGATGIEIDIRLTKDKVPILFHDDNFSERVVNGQFFVGLVSNYTYSHIQSFCTLKNGETIPTLRQALDAVLNETTLSLVWLDVKSAETINLIMPIQIEYNEKAKKMGRNKLEIMVGLALDETVDAYLSNPLRENSPAVCELDFGKVTKTNAPVWGPRWTMGKMEGEIDEMHKEGKKVFIWTIDMPENLKLFMENLKTDGILSNYPTMVAYEYYTRYQK